jgi:hypothetical protein
MNIVKVSDDCALTREDVLAAPFQEELLDYALSAYGYLLIMQPPREYTLDEFANLIAHHFDVAAGSTYRMVVDTLKQVQIQTERCSATLH